MPFKNITFIKQGTEPEPTRSTESEKLVQEVIDKAKGWPAGQSMKIEFEEADTKKSQPSTLVSKLRKRLTKGYEVYRVGWTVIITRSK
jgi:hypothetical protein